MSRPSDPRRGGGPNKTKVTFDAARTKRTTSLARARQINSRVVGRARDSVLRVIQPGFMITPPFIDPLDQLRARAWNAVRQAALMQTTGYVIKALEGGASPVSALSSAALDRAFREANNATGGHFTDEHVKIAVKLTSSALGEKGQQIVALPAVLLLLQEARRAAKQSEGESGEFESLLGELDGHDAKPRVSPGMKSRAKKAMTGAAIVLNTINNPLGQAAGGFSPSQRDKGEYDIRTAPMAAQSSAAPPDPPGQSLGSTAMRGPWLTASTRWGGGHSEAEGETGWDVASRRLMPGAHAGAAPRAQATGTPSSTTAQASAARKRIRAAAAPAFASAVDTAVNADLILAFVRRQGGAPDLAKLRHAYVATAVRHFAAEFVRTISSAPKGTSEQLALGAIIASALAQTAQTFPIVPPAAVPAMSVLIHKALQPQMQALARMAATIATAPATPRPTAPLHELAW